MKESFQIYDNKAELMSTREQLITPLEVEDSKVKLACFKKAPML